MDLAFSEEQEMLKTMARDFLTEKLPKTVVREIEESELGYSPELWREIAELGWVGLVLPEKYGGGGMSFLDLAVLLEEMGRACLPGPYFSAVVLGGLSILDAGSEEQKAKYLPKIASGELIVTLALTEPSARYEATAIEMLATASGDSYILNGTKLFVPDAHIADYMLVAARTGEKAEGKNGISLFIVDARSPGIKHNMLQTMANDNLCEVLFDTVSVPAENILGQFGGGWSEIQKIVRRAAVAKCCEVVGCVQQALDMTVEYAKERKQFGRPIGSLQIIQHYCADMATDVDGARLATNQAAWLISEGLPCTLEVAIAKAWTSEASQRIMALAHQVHGAIGYSMDHDLQFFTRRAKAAEATFGDANFYREIVAQEMGL